MTCECFCCVFGMCVRGLECCSKCNTANNTQTNYRLMTNNEWVCPECTLINNTPICEACRYNRITNTSTGMKRFKSKKSVKKSLKKSKKSLNKSKKSVKKSKKSKKSSK